MCDIILTNQLAVFSQADANKQLNLSFFNQVQAIVFEIKIIKHLLLCGEDFIKLKENHLVT